MMRLFLYSKLFCSDIAINKTESELAGIGRDVAIGNIEMNIKFSACTFKQVLFFA